jgi:hypothetical protein
MIDPVLNRKLENCKKLMALWRSFHERLTDCIKGKAFTPQDEAEFLKLKSQIAILHDSFLESVEGSLPVAQSVISVVERCILLRQVAKLSPAEIKKMEIEWHESYLLMNETIGLLQEKIDKIARVSRASYETRRVVDKAVSHATRLLTSRGFHFFLGVTALIVITVVLPMLGVFSYDFLQKTPVTNKIYMAVRGLLRTTVMSDLEFQEWDDYDKNVRQPMPVGYNPADIPANQQEGRKDAFLIKQYPGLQVLDLRPDVRDALHTEIRKYTVGGDIYVLFVMFKKTGEAGAMLQKIENWRKGIALNSMADQVENQISIGTYCNILYMIYAANENTRNAVKQTLAPKK